MARRNDIQYVRYYTFGAAARKLEEPRQEQKAKLPEYKPQKRIPIPFEPVAVLGSIAAIVMAVMMLAGLFRVHQTMEQVKAAQAQVIALERVNESLQNEYEQSYDLEEVRAAAESMGMIPESQAMRLSVPVEIPADAPVQLSWWDSLLAGFRQLFA